MFECYHQLGKDYKTAPSYLFMTLNINNPNNAMYGYVQKSFSSKVDFRRVTPKLEVQMGQKALPVMKYRYCNRILDNIRKAF